MRGEFEGLQVLKTVKLRVEVLYKVLWARVPAIFKFKALIKHAVGESRGLRWTLQDGPGKARISWLRCLH